MPGMGMGMMGQMPMNQGMMGMPMQGMMSTAMGTPQVRMGVAQVSAWFEFSGYLNVDESDQIRTCLGGSIHSIFIIFFLRCNPRYHQLFPRHKMSISALLTAIASSSVAFLKKVRSLVKTMLSTFCVLVFLQPCICGSAHRASSLEF